MRCKTQIDLHKSEMLLVGDIEDIKFFSWVLARKVDCLSSSYLDISLGFYIYGQVSLGCYFKDFIIDLAVERPFHRRKTYCKRGPSERLPTFSLH